VSKHPNRKASRRSQPARRRSLAALGIVALAIALGAIVFKVAASDGTSAASAGSVLAADRPAAPAFSLAGLDGENVSLSSLRGKTVVLGFVQPDCTSCIGTLHTLSAVASHLSRSGTAVIAVNVNTYTTAADLASFARQVGVTSGPRFTLDQGDQTARAYHVRTLETEVVIDPTGHIVLRGVALPASTVLSAVQQAT
jgi:peroxiredoxin